MSKKAEGVPTLEISFVDQRYVSFTEEGLVDVLVGDADDAFVYSRSDRALLLELHGLWRRLQLAYPKVKHVSFDACGDLLESRIVE